MKTRKIFLGVICCVASVGANEWSRFFTCCFGDGLKKWDHSLQSLAQNFKKNADSGAENLPRLISKVCNGSYRKNVPFLIAHLQADGLMKQRSLKTVKEAADIYQQALSIQPNDIDLQLKSADALNCVMRIQVCCSFFSRTSTLECLMQPGQTHANTILIEGNLDTPANKRLWSELGPKALRLARTARNARPDDVRALAVYTDAFIFAASSKGIITQALTGAGAEYQRLAAALMRTPSHDSAVGHALLGCFFLCAPWPVGNKDLAMRNIDEAVRCACWPAPRASRSTTARRAATVRPRCRLMDGWRD